MVAVVGTGDVVQSTDTRTDTLSPFFFSIVVGVCLRVVSCEKGF